MKIEIEVNKGRVADLLCCAFEGGSGYWCKFIQDRAVRPVNIDFNELNGWEPGPVYAYCHYPLFEGGSISIRDEESENSAGTFTLALVHIQKGLGVMTQKYPRHFENFMNEDEDATTGDVFLQCCVFGEVIYG